MSNKVDFEKLAQAAQRSLDNPGQIKKPLPKVKPGTGPTIFLCRHTQTTDNVARIFSGRRDPGLTQLGQDQAQQLADRLKDQKSALIVLPPWKRCRLTVGPVTKHLPGMPVETDPLLLE
ncbi:MAG: phosphoglycerate mutase family protein, partial [Patescibacteria group bacterium]